MMETKTTQPGGSECWESHGEATLRKPTGRPTNGEFVDQALQKLIGEKAFAWYQFHVDVKSSSS